MLAKLSSRGRQSSLEQRLISRCRLPTSHRIGNDGLGKLASNTLCHHNASVRNISLAYLLHRWGPSKLQSFSSVQGVTGGPDSHWIELWLCYSLFISKDDLNMGCRDYRSTIMYGLSENALFIWFVPWKWFSGVFVRPPVAFVQQSSPSWSSCCSTRACIYTRPLHTVS